MALANRDIGERRRASTSVSGVYTVEARLKPLSFGDVAGLVFRYRTNRHIYLFGIRGGKEAVLRLRLPIEKQLRVADWRELGSVPFPYDVKPPSAIFDRM